MFRWRGLWPSLALALVCMASAAPLAADDAEQGAALCERAIASGAARARASRRRCCTPSRSPRPDGRTAAACGPGPGRSTARAAGYWFSSRDEALAFARASLAEGRPSFDVGCFQINYRYHGQNFPSLEAMFDQDHGAAYAAQFLRSFYRGDWSAAAGSYHSQTPKFASVYRARFDRILAGLGGAPLVVAAAPAPELPVPAARAAPTKPAQEPHPDDEQAADHHHREDPEAPPPTPPTTPPRRAPSRRRPTAASFRPPDGCRPTPPARSDRSGPR